jgi:N-methylhydantoinase A
LKPGGYILGIDVGGTFADVVCVGPGGLHVRKTPSRPDAPGADVVQGIRELAEDLGLHDAGSLLRRTELIVHGSTIATNTLLTRTGVLTGLLTTRGFRDIVEMRGGRRESTFDSHMPNAPALAPRELRLEVAERTDRDGTSTDLPQRSEVEEATAKLLAAGTRAVAIAFKHSGTNPRHEELAAGWVRNAAPEIFVTQSAELSRRPRLYDRTSSAVINAYVGPPTATYISQLGQQLTQLGFAGQLLIMGGGGGLMSIAESVRVPITLVLSGPAAGPVAATLSLAGAPSGNAILVDMGGTSFDVSVLRGRAVETTTSRDVNRYRIGVPMLDIHTIGAGGGSIATVDEAGLLQVGPASAGAIPGPAAYGLGGLEPTVTDANLVAGFLDAGAVLGNARRLSPQLARRAVAGLGRRLGLSPEQCAVGIRRVANGSMVAAVREMTVGRGFDPRGLSLIVGGGAGPLHGAEIAEELGIDTVIVPSHAGVLCAVGMAASRLTYESAVSVVRPLDEVDRPSLARSLADVRDQLQARLRSASAVMGTISESLECEARYEGQFHELLVPVSDGELTGRDQAMLVRRFHAAHEAAYGFRSESARLEIVNVRIKEMGVLRPDPRRKIQRARRTERLRRVGERSVFVVGRSAPVRVPVLAPTGGSGGRQAGGSTAGPVLIDLPTSTVYVPNGWTFSLSPQGDIRLRRMPRAKGRS